MVFKKIVIPVIASFVILTAVIYSQNSGGDFRLKGETKKGFKITSFKNNVFARKNPVNLADTVEPVNKPANTKTMGSKKSAGLAFIYGLFIPGMGHVYADKFKTGKYFMISEAAIWLTYAAFSIYGNWLLDDAYGYASQHAGITVGSKERDDKFFIDIANYNNVDEYNNEMLRFGEYDKLYYPDQGYGFYWNSETERRLYRSDKLAGDRTLNDRLFVVGAVLINHLISGISAVFAANSYNDELYQKGSGGFSLSAGVQKHFNRIDGIKLNLVKQF
jgi:TM2 domain-containing membrane protein YozV